MIKKLFSYYFDIISVVVIVFMTFQHLPAGASPYTEIEWVALMPEGDLEILLNPPNFLFEIPDGSEQDSFDVFQDEKLLTEEAQRFQQAMKSTKVVDTYENKSIRIPGFIVPLESDENQNATEFFIVPYFGACLHMPPPPPNQMMYSSFKAGVKVENLYEPFWFEGTLKIETNHNVLGTSAYRLVLDKVMPYEDE
jgi:hypothetical protein